MLAGTEGISIQTGGDAAPDATIEGTPFTFARLATGDPMRSLRAGGAQVSGDAEIAQVFQMLFAAARPDFEEELSRLTGDVAAHEIAGFARGALAFGLRARDTFAANVAEYLTEESRDLPDAHRGRRIPRRRRPTARGDRPARSPPCRHRQAAGRRVISRRVAGRLLTIHRVLVRYGLDDFVRATHLYRPLRFVFWLSPWTWFRRRRGNRGERLRRALEDLGPIFVKFGQVVSTRRDLLPGDIADELAKLQDRVPPFPGEAARARIEEALGRPVAELFRDFDVAPLAAASIAQVHAATLNDGREVVVKVLRPDMQRGNRPRSGGATHARGACARVLAGIATTAAA